VDTLPPDFPEIATEVFGETGEGNIFLSPVAPTQYKLFVVDNAGGLVSYIESPPSQRFLDFKQVNDTTYTYHTDPTWGEPVYYLTDTLYNIVDSFRAGNGQVLDSHDIYFLENGHAYVLVYEIEEVDMSQIVTGGNPNAQVAGLTIQEVDNQQNVHWEWRSFDHFEVTDGISQGGSSLINFTLANISYVHANSIKADEEGNILISSRNLHEVTKIDRSTGNVIWRMGGKNNQFTFIDDPQNGFTDQHDATWTSPNTLLIFDNGNQQTNPISRVIEYEIDEVNMTATLIWEYQNPEGALSLASGNARRLDNGNTFIGWGILSPNMGPKVMEVDPEGNTVFEFYFLDNGIPSIQFSYRAFRFSRNIEIPVNQINLLDESNRLTVSPNPAKDKIRFTLDDENKTLTDAQLEITDIQGRIILTKNMDEFDSLSTFEIPTHDVASGVYFYQLKSDTNIYKGKFIVQ